MKFSIGVFEGLLNAFDVLYNVQRSDDVDVHLGGISHQAHNGLVRADGNMSVHSQSLEPLGQRIQLGFVRVFLEQYNHDNHSSAFFFFQRRARPGQ